MLPFDRLTEMAHLFIAAHLKPGDRVIDATAGNGHDTLFLAEAVGPLGRVYAFDIQESALQVTASRLESNGFSGRVKLLEKNHEKLIEHVKPPVSAVMYNLGYLPGSDKNTTTTAETTIKSLEQALIILKPGGLISIIVYCGHERGREEREALMTYCSSLDPFCYRVIYLSLLNRKNEPPELLLLQKGLPGKA